MSKILIINAGSSSIKWTLFDYDLNMVAKGVIERIKQKLGLLTIVFNGIKTTKEVALPSFDFAINELVKEWEENKVIRDFNEIEHIAFRIVNGGPHLRETCEVTKKAINYLKDALDLAPVHNKGALETILAIEKVFVKQRKTLHFDTSFHKTLDKIEYTYPIDNKLSEKLNIRKYGFHGLSHHYIALKMEEILNKKEVNIVNLHIGNGASLCAIEKSKSIATSMGFTPLAGVMMGTRSGDVDPSIIPYIMKHNNWTIDQTMHMLNENSGLLGVSEYSQDFRDIKTHIEKPQIKFTYDLYIQKIADYLINYLNKIQGKIDAIVFTAGVAENNSDLRKHVIERINLIPLDIDDSKNNQNDFKEYNLISSKKSSIQIYVVRTNEELYIAKEAKELDRR